MRSRTQKESAGAKVRGLSSQEWGSIIIGTVSTHEEHDNTMAPRTIGALVLRPTGNAQGSYQFFSLSTRRVLTRNRATTLPMPDDVIEQVHRIARRQKAHAGMVFKNHNRVRVKEFYDNDEDSEMDEEYMPDNDDKSNAGYNTDDEVDNTDDEVDHDAQDDPHDALNIAGADPEDESENVSIEAEEDRDNDNALDGGIDNNNNDGENSYGSVASEEDPEIDKEEKEEDFDDSKIAGVEHNNEEIKEETTSDEDSDHGMETQEDIMDNKYGKRSGRYKLIPRKQRDYSHLFATKCDAFQKSDRRTKKKHQMPSKIPTCKPVTHDM